MRQLPDGNWLLKVDGELLQTISEQQKRDILKAQIELESARKELELLRGLKRDYEAVTALFSQERKARESEAAALAAQLAIVNERQVEADRLIQMLVKQTKRNRIEAALSNPLLTLAFKLAVPLGTMIGGLVK